MMIPENGNSSAIELLEPVVPNLINKFLDNKGEGMHHVCYYWKSDMQEGISS